YHQSIASSFMYRRAVTGGCIEIYKAFGWVLHTGLTLPNDKESHPRRLSPLFSSLNRMLQNHFSGCG
ncbi:MAG: hypothetical protein KKC05_00815, partial [Nanoarchaeota archaeon]|nr:hypothetical protein [Nanoarchaeota archaeon]